MGYDNLSSLRSLPSSSLSRQSLKNISFKTILASLRALHGEYINHLQDFTIHGKKYSIFSKMMTFFYRLHSLLLRGATTLICVSGSGSGHKHTYMNAERAVTLYSIGYLNVFLAGNFHAKTNLFVQILQETATNVAFAQERSRCPLRVPLIDCFRVPADVLPLSMHEGLSVSKIFSIRHPFYIDWTRKSARTSHKTLH